MCNTPDCTELPKFKGLCRRCYNRTYEKTPQRMAYKTSAEYRASRQPYYTPRSKTEAFKNTMRKYSKTDKFKKQQAKYRMSEKARFSMGMRQALRRNIEWAITFDEFSALMKLRCHYCAGELSVFGANLDRKDNLLGYFTANVVTCCGDCNRTKGDRLTYAEMVAVSNLLKEMRHGTKNLSLDTARMGDDTGETESS